MRFLISKIDFFKRRRQGFTLLEFIVAITVFLVVITVAVGGFVRALKTHRQAMSLMAANSNVSAAIEQISREIRTGSNFVISGGALTFDNADGAPVTYEASGGSITRTSLSPAQSITDNNVIVDYLRFNLGPINNYPPRIIINLGIRPNQPEINTSINFQTTISSRNF